MNPRASRAGMPPEERAGEVVGGGAGNDGSGRRALRFPVASAALGWSCGRDVHAALRHRACFRCSTRSPFFMLPCSVLRAPCSVLRVARALRSCSAFVLRTPCPSCPACALLSVPRAPCPVPRAPCPVPVRGAAPYRVLTPRPVRRSRRRPSARRPRPYASRHGTARRAGPAPCGASGVRARARSPPRHRTPPNAGEAPPRRGPARAMPRRTARRVSGAHPRAHARRVPQRIAGTIVIHLSEIPATNA